MTETANLDQLLASLARIMAQLRDPENGCDWDKAQNFSTIAPYTIEEAYEVDDAIRRHDMADLRDELGDLLLQVVFHAQMAAEIKAFTLRDVIKSIINKMISRHSHVFSEKGNLDKEAVITHWEHIKKQERMDKSITRTLDGVTMSLPALARAQKLQERAARVGFDWANIPDVEEKIQEELEEVRVAARGETPDRVAEEIGDLLFACVNLARRLDVDAEQSLRLANDKFTKRFNKIEDILKVRNQPIESAGLALLDQLWTEVKRDETA